MQITPRDRILFRHLSDYGMLTTKQINAIIFNSIATTTVLRRLRILEQEKLIKRLLGLNSGEPLWIITEKVLEHFSEGDYFKRYWNKNLLEHDYKLLCLRLHFESIGLAKSWEPEHKIKYLIFKKYPMAEAKNKLIPDGLIIIEEHTKKLPVAIELELTLKSKERLRAILKRYIEKRDLHMLWYICGSNLVMKSIQAIWNQLKGSSSLKLKLSLYEEAMKLSPAHSNAQAGAHGMSKQFDQFTLPPKINSASDLPPSTWVREGGQMLQIRGGRDMNLGGEISL